jgi:hypothetical protein
VSVTEAKRRPRFSQSPPGLVDQSIFEKILRDLPLREELRGVAPELDYTTRAERYVYLTANYVREFHTQKYRPGEINEALIDLRRKAAAYLEVLQKSVGMIVDVYNEAAQRDELKAQGDERNASGHSGPASIPTIGEAQKVTEAFLAELDRVQVDDTGERGRKRSEAVGAIAKQAMMDFEDITGKKPNRSNKAGSLTEFVSDIFKAASVQESTDHYLRGGIGSACAPFSPTETFC